MNKTKFTELEQYWLDGGVKAEKTARDYMTTIRQIYGKDISSQKDLAIAAQEIPIENVMNLKNPKNGKPYAKSTLKKKLDIVATGLSHSYFDDEDQKRKRTYYSLKNDEGNEIWNAEEYIKTLDGTRGPMNQELKEELNEHSKSETEELNWCKLSKIQSLANKSLQKLKIHGIELTKKTKNINPAEDENTYNKELEAITNALIARLYSGQAYEKKENGEKSYHPPRRSDWFGHEDSARNFHPTMWMKIYPEPEGKPEGCNYARHVIGKKYGTHGRIYFHLEYQKTDHQEIIIIDDLPTIKLFVMQKKWLLNPPTNTKGVRQRRDHNVVFPKFKCSKENGCWNEPHNNNSSSIKVKELFQHVGEDHKFRQPSMNILRHIWATEKHAPLHKKVEENAKKMSHSVKTDKEYVKV